MKKGELRKVQFSTYNEEKIEFTNHLGYFHIWGRIEHEIKTPISGSEIIGYLYSVTKEIVTMGIVEDKNTGKVYTLFPDQITFLNN